VLASTALAALDDRFRGHDEKGATPSIKFTSLGSAADCRDLIIARVTAAVDADPGAVRLQPEERRRAALRRFSTSVICGRNLRLLQAAAGLDFTKDGKSNSASCRLIPSAAASALEPDRVLRRRRRADGDRHELYPHRRSLLTPRSGRSGSDALSGNEGDRDLGSSIGSGPALPSAEGSGIMEQTHLIVHVFAR